MWEPKRQECIGHYLYGTGYYARERQPRPGSGQEVPGFCDTCPARRACWDQHRAAVAKAKPLEVAAFTAAMDQGMAAGDKQAGGRLAVRMAASGNPDPWMAAALGNMQLGIADRNG